LASQGRRYCMWEGGRNGRSRVREYERDRLARKRISYGEERGEAGMGGVG
jgi:hypothetical protein